MIYIGKSRNIKSELTSILLGQLQSARKYKMKYLQLPMMKQVVN
jgi:hypothetical protein